MRVRSRIPRHAPLLGLNIEGRGTRSAESTSILLYKKIIFLFEDQRSLPGPPLKMASINQSPEVKSILKQTYNLTIVLSNDSLGVAGKLLSKELICREVYSKMLIGSYTPAEKAAILVEAVGNTIEIAPDKFQCFLEILSEVVCAKEVVEKLRSTYQSESLSSLMHNQSYQSREDLCSKSGRG